MGHFSVWCLDLLTGRVGLEIIRISDIGVELYTELDIWVRVRDVEVKVGLDIRVRVRDVEVKVGLEIRVRVRDVEVKVGLEIKMGNTILKQSFS